MQDPVLLKYYFCLEMAHRSQVLKIWLPSKNISNISLSCTVPISNCKLTCTLLARIDQSPIEHDGYIYIGTSSMETHIAEEGSPFYDEDFSCCSFKGKMFKIETSKY